LKNVLALPKNGGITTEVKTIVGTGLQSLIDATQGHRHSGLPIINLHKLLISQHLDLLILHLLHQPTRYLVQLQSFLNFGQLEVVVSHSQATQNYLRPLILFRIFEVVDGGLEGQQPAFQRLLLVADQFSVLGFEVIEIDDETGVGLAPHEQS
jgi:hypothetical protein